MKIFVALMISTIISAEDVDLSKFSSEKFLNDIALDALKL
jgi:hypothetical protein